MSKKHTSIRSQLQHRLLPSLSCDGQYFWSQNGWDRYSINPWEFGGICKQKAFAQDVFSSISTLQLPKKAIMRNRRIYTLYLKQPIQRGGLITYKFMANFALRVERLLVTVSMIWHISLHRELCSQSQTQSPIKDVLCLPKTEVRLILFF